MQSTSPGLPHFPPPVVRDHRGPEATRCAFGTKSVHTVFFVIRVLWVLPMCFYSLIGHVLIANVRIHGRRRSALLCFFPLTSWSQIIACPFCRRSYWLCFTFSPAVEEYRTSLRETSARLEEMRLGKEAETAPKDNMDSLMAGRRVSLYLLAHASFLATASIIRGWTRSKLNDPDIRAQRSLRCSPFRPRLTNF